MESSRREIRDDYGFRFLENVASPAVELVAVGRQSQSSREYYWENKNRPAAFLFQYTLGGSGTLKTGRKSYVIEKGEAFFLQMPDDECYYFEEGRNCAPWEFIYVMVSGEGAWPYYRYVVERGGKILSLSEFHPAVSALWELYHKAGDGLLQNAFVASSEAFRLLCLLCAYAGQDGGALPGLIDRAEAYMKENFSRQISLAETAEYLGVSQSHLSREFLRYTGRQPVHYLNRLRLEAAAEMLNSTSKTLEEIGRCCGFSDGNYFGKVFKKYMKLSPGQFRKQVRAQGYSHLKI